MCSNFVYMLPGVLDTSLPQAPTPTLQVVPSKTPTSLVLSPLATFFRCLFCASGLLKLIQTLPQRLAGLLACLVCLHSVLYQLWAFSQVTEGAEEEEGKRRHHKNKQPLFQYANNMYAVCIRYTPSSLIHRSSAGTQWCRDCIGRWVFVSHSFQCKVLLYFAVNYRTLSRFIYRRCK